MYMYMHALTLLPHTYVQINQLNKNIQVHVSLPLLFGGCGPGKVKGELFDETRGGGGGRVLVT